MSALAYLGPEGTFTQSAVLALASFGLQAFLWSIKTGPCFALALELAPANLRAFAVSLLVVMAGVIGNGLGPLVVGVLSDSLDAGPAGHSIRDAMMVIPLSLLIGAGALLLAARRSSLGRSHFQQRP